MKCLSSGNIPSEMTYGNNPGSNGPSKIGNRMNWDCLVATSLAGSGGRANMRYNPWGMGQSCVPSRMAKSPLFTDVHRVRLLVGRKLILTLIIEFLLKGFSDGGMLFNPTHDMIFEGGFTRYEKIRTYSGKFMSPIRFCEFQCELFASGCADEIVFDGDFFRRWLVCLIWYCIIHKRIVSIFDNLSTSF
jgi:hypothetical protein